MVHLFGPSQRCEPEGHEDNRSASQQVSIFVTEVSVVRFGQIMSQQTCVPVWSSTWAFRTDLHVNDIVAA